MRIPGSPGHSNKGPPTSRPSRADTTSVLRTTSGRRPTWWPWPTAPARWWGESPFGSHKSGHLEVRGLTRKPWLLNVMNHLACGETQDVSCHFMFNFTGRWTPSRKHEDSTCSGGAKNHQLYPSRVENFTLYLKDTWMSQEVRKWSVNAL